MRITSRLLCTLICAPALWLGAQYVSVYPFLSPVHAQKANDVFTGHVVAVTAGDTMDVRVADGRTVTVRLHGVESPTTPRALRETAARYTSHLVLDAEVRVEVRGITTESVVYGEVFPQIGGESVNFKIVRDGLAIWMSEYAGQRADLEGAETFAKSTARGLWGADDGSNVILPESVADVLRREAERKRRAARQSPTPSPPSNQEPFPAPPSPQPEAARTASPSPEPSPVSAPAEEVTRTEPPLPGPFVGGLSAAVLTFLSLIAYGAAFGMGFTPKRLLCQLFFGFVAGGFGAMASVLPVAAWRQAIVEGGATAPMIVAFVGTLISVLLLRAGGEVVSAAARLRRPDIDPRLARPGPVKLYGTARSATGELVRSQMGRIKGLYVREVTARYTSDVEKGKRRVPPRWVEVGDTANAVDFEIFSEAGDGTGSAVVLAAQDEETPQALAPARWVPYHVARFYNEIPSDAWNTKPYEGDTRTEVFFVPEDAMLTVWGSLYILAPPEPVDKTDMPVPRVASDSAIGTLLICDGPETRAYAARGRASLSVGIGLFLLGVAFAAAAIWGVLAGGVIARQSAIAALGIGLAILLVLAIANGALLARNADREAREGERDPFRRPASATWDRYNETFPGVIIAPVVAD